MVSEQIRHKPGCTSTEAGLKLEILELSRGGIVAELYYPSSGNKGADQHPGYREADLRLYRLLVLPMRRLI